MRRSMRLGGNLGFTLIELVVVITILGILAAFAVPRFIALQANARAAAVESLHGALRSASAATHSMWLITRGATVAMEGATINMVNGYPTYDDIDDTLVDAAGFAYDPTTGVFSSTGAGSAATCSVTYTPPAVAGSPPSFLLDVSNCD
jgi:MSHA pilin protein MshA